MLTTKIQKSIRDSYQNLQFQLENFIPRRGQNYLVAEIAKTLCGSYHKSNRILIAEAGTGIGKSLSYLMAAVPVAVLNNRKVVVSTATVALQEQLISKDLPLFRRITDRQFSFILAKGRQRYCCTEKLAAACGVDGSQIALFESKPQKKDVELFITMYEKLAQGKWNGDRDSWPKAIKDELWQLIVSDKHSCNGSFAGHRDCPFQKARSELDKADVIIANHSLVMADADLGGGVILPEPENTIYIFDEAHHLPHVARDHASASASLKGAASWLEKLNQSVTKFSSLAEEKRVARFRNELQETLQQLILSLSQLTKQFVPEQFEEKRYRFEHGELPQWLEEESKTLKRLSQKANQSVAKIADLIAERVKEGELAARLAEPALTELGFYIQRLENLAQVWLLMAEPKREKGAPLARWLEIHPEREGDFIVNVSPLEIGWQLDQQIWSRCIGAILVSATMRALNSFSYFCSQAGISEKAEDGTRFLALASPFDYQNQAELLIPAMRFEPQAKEYTDYLVERLAEFIQPNKANLVLFASYWQMREVAEKISTDFVKRGWALQVQGEISRTEILNKHKMLVQCGKTSVMFGTSSFSEGLDLPGELLENLVITKIPFAVPTSPVEQAHAEYIEKRGGNSFIQITVPEASKKLIQAVGRLLRKERDSGRVVILDRRIVSKRYGKSLLDSLPPFKRTIEY
ncbi:MULTISPECIES: ATP-dependent DNA helicase DinG [unclassified Vibrio]|uniref:ATP-dependent DNA helicase DinG n=1 Tax=unclassified Vibrio TaxID=2614977 RepID=UPI000B8E49A2|nr:MULTISPECIES: ATP-dependent DNA helicase DinG [unclassified Vibrio]NAW91643.1 ATP-dependent DNA helicase DinG [Vibrio sp. V24_P1S3T111]OXX20118.1 ATP-dependent DNA helicase DinG [Vibrio sp. V06_P1A73T115]OXX22010.1 ATP-dependent DNA helicase DinG [Vibrio sp. V05_P4A8T149]OXX30159.1 ATP-dependent DNA helicase DinG [Vibrio sp. V14_P6S14T42]OXX35345.1 ATP-dependent DNA helicase DinG [Vibrio sp. V04_P4A5T148]